MEQPAPDREPSARISMRAVSALEIASVFVSVIIISWAIVPLQPSRRWVAALPALLAMALMINSQRARGESLGEVGLGADHFFRALRLLAAPTLIACAGFAAIGYSTGSFHRTSHFWATARRSTGRRSPSERSRTRSGWRRHISFNASGAPTRPEPPCFRPHEASRCSARSTEDCSICALPSSCGIPRS